MKPSNFLRVVSAALVLSTLSFAAGVAGDLSLADGPRSGVRVVLRIPPELPADTVRAAPLPPMATPVAEARPLLQPVRFEPPQLLEPLDAPLVEMAFAARLKENPHPVLKHESVHAA